MIRDYPLADLELTIKTLDLILNAVTHNLLKVGTDEATKTLNRGLSELIVIAADTEPIELVSHLPLLCEEKNIPYVYLRSKQGLGHACSIKRAASACAITKVEGSELEVKIVEVKQDIERFMLLFSGSV